MIALFVLTARKRAAALENAAVEIAIKCTQHLIAKNAVALGEELFPGVFELLAMVKNEAIQTRLFRSPHRVSNNL